MKTAKKVLSLVLVLTLIFILAVPAFAGEKKDSIKYVSFGDSSTIGYGLQGFDFSHYGRDSHVDAAYIFRFAKYLEAVTGKDVEHTNLALCAMRTNEFAYAVNDSFRTGDLDAYGRNYSNWYDNQYPEGIHNKYCNAIVDADIITYDLGTNNFGNYLVARLAGILGVDIGFSWEGYADEHFADLMEKYDLKIGGEIITGITKYLANSLKDAVDDNMLAAMTDAVLFAFGNFCVGFDQSMDAIYELNPDVKLIVFGMYNTLAGTSVKYNGITIDIGAINGYMMDMVSEYIISMNSHCGQYSFADLKGGVENIIQAIGRGEMYDDMRDDLLDLLYDGNMLGAEGAQALIEKLAYGDEPVTVPATLQNAQYSYRGGLNDPAYDQLRAGAQSVIETFQKAGAYTDPIDLDAGLPLVQNGLEGLSELFVLAFLDWDSASELSKAATHLILNMLENGSGCHPSEYGCTQKLNAAIKAYESPVAANGTHFTRSIESASDIFTRLFKSPNWLKTIIEIIRDYFGPLFSIIRFG